MEQVSTVVAQSGAAVEQVSTVVAQSRAAVEQVSTVVAQSGAAVEQVARVVHQSSGAVTRVDDVLARSQTAVQRAFDILAGTGGLVDTADHLLTRARPAIDQLLPVLQRFAETFDGHEVEAAVLLLDRLPVLLEAIDRDVLPLAGALNSVGPELHSLLGLVGDLHRMVGGLPGVGLLRRRGREG